MDGREQPDRKGLLGSLLSGAVPLGQAFWWYAIVLGSLWNLLATVASLMLVTFGQPEIGLVAHLSPVPYSLLCVIAVWRSAARYEGPRHWAVFARTTIAIWALLAIAL